MERIIQLEKMAKKVKKAVSTLQHEYKDIYIIYDSFSKDISKDIPGMPVDSNMTECRWCVVCLKNDRKRPVNNLKPRHLLIINKACRFAKKNKDYHDNQTRFDHDVLEKINEYLDKQAHVCSPEPVPDENYSNALDIMLFLWNCESDMEIWFQPLITFGCDNLLYLEIIAQWDKKSVEDILRRVMAQPDGIHLKEFEADLMFLLWNFKQRF